jgi:hypothetical protein
MRPIENILALIAAVLVAGAVVPWSLRLACAVAAVGVLLLMIVNRYRAHTAKVQKRRVLDVYSAVERLRSERKARFEQGRPRRRSG